MPAKYNGVVIGDSLARTLEIERPKVIWEIYDDYTGMGLTKSKIRTLERKARRWKTAPNFKDLPSEP